MSYDEFIPDAPEEYACLMCGAWADDDSKFCGEHCESEYYHENRTCESCGGEFWDGGTSCTCQEDDHG